MQKAIGFLVCIKEHLKKLFANPDERHRTHDYLIDRTGFDKDSLPLATESGSVMIRNDPENWVDLPTVWSDTLVVGPVIPIYPLSPGDWTPYVPPTPTSDLRAFRHLSEFDSVAEQENVILDWERLPYRPHERQEARIIRVCRQFGVRSKKRVMSIRSDIHSTTTRRGFEEEDHHGQQVTVNVYNDGDDLNLRALKLSISSSIWIIRQVRCVRSFLGAGLVRHTRTGPISISTTASIHSSRLS